jgi:hypothetical protein
MSTPKDIAEETAAHLHASIGQRQFGVEYGYAVTWMPGQVQGPQGPVQVPLWTLLIVRPSPLLGGHTLHHLAQIATARPTFAQIDTEVEKGIRLLAELHASMQKPPEAPPAQGVRLPLEMSNGRRHR